jgi:hypothetical protein
MEIALSFDDTGSMSSVRNEVRRKTKELVDNLFGLDPNIRISVIIHNDYCDRDTIQKLDLTNDKTVIKDFINRTSSCGGGDADECYELVLSEFQNLSWTSSERIAILIGDCNPHEKGYKYGSFVNHLDWREEVKKCATQGIKIYGVHALGSSYSKKFYEAISKGTGGTKLDLAQFSHITQYITAVAYQQVGRLDEYYSSSKEFSTNHALKNMFSRLKAIAGGVLPEVEVDFAKLSRFQVMDVDHVQKIKDFVESNGISYKKGKGFYQLINKELVQANKEVFMVHKETGEVIDDTVEARKLLGLPYGTKGNLNPKNIPICNTYDVYIQSNSYTRNLDPGTKFLYELERT